MPANILTNNYQQQNVFLKGQLFKAITYTNSTGSTVNLVPGRLLGQILATAKTLPHVSTATDGSEMPRGICGDFYTVPDGTTVVIQMCYAGDINQNAIVFGGSDTLDTVVRTVTTGGGTVGALLTANTDIKLYLSQELSGYDN